MVDSILSSGLSAYKNAQSLAGSGKGGGIGAIGDSAGGSFSDMLSGFMTESMGALKKGEAATISAAKGQADITDVVGAVQNAMRTLETVTAVRDKVVSAYQDILRMPI